MKTLCLQPYLRNLSIREVFLTTTAKELQKEVKWKKKNPFQIFI